MLALADEQSADQLRPLCPGGTKLFAGPDAMVQLVRDARADIVLNGMVGAAGLAPTMEAIACGCDLAIANKEALVCAGAIIMPAAAKAGINVLPVDSEHSAIFQCLRSGQPSEVARVVITASGGALRDLDEQSAAVATIEQALNHPTWRMGRKITIDSATLINKALEMIEAHWLFGLAPEQIQVVLHAESIVHSYVEFCDGSVIAQLGQPDMKTPIAFALNWPDRPKRNVPPLDLAAVGRLTFGALPPRFLAAIELGRQVIRLGDAAGAVLNSANEAAVEAFLSRQILFGRIVPIVQQVLAAAGGTGFPARASTASKGCATREVTLDTLVQADKWARQQVLTMINEQ
jgi:1-deoxy-D-xylulose-5-phosphate reductoisomerase